MIEDGRRQAAERVRELKQGGYYFWVCWTCKRAEWWKQDAIPTFIAGHEDHKYTILTRDVYEDANEFRLWFLEIMGWLAEEGG